MQPGPPGQTVQVYKLRRDGSLRIAYEAGLLRAGPEGWLVEARWAGARWQGRFASMEPGDPCREYYPARGCHVVLRLMSPAGQLRGFYVDLCAPVELGPGPTARYRDLVLDLFITPDGAWHLLDAQEFLEWTTAQALPHEVRWVVRGLQECLLRWEQGQPPFGEEGAGALNPRG